MTRRKVQLTWIINPSSRKATFKKRRDCLMRKVKEISTLTGEDACGIVLSPEDGDPPVFWPPSIQEVLTRFFNLPESDQCKKMTTLDSFMQEKVSKMEEQLVRERRKAKDEEINFIMHSIYSHGKLIDSLSIEETHELFWYLDELRKKCELRILNLNQDNLSYDHLFVSLVPPPFINNGFVNPNNGRYGMEDVDMNNVAIGSKMDDDHVTDDDED